MPEKEEDKTQSQNSNPQTSSELVTPKPDKNVEAPPSEYLTEGFDPAKLKKK